MPSKVFGTYEVLDSKTSSTCPHPYGILACSVTLSCGADMPSLEACTECLHVPRAHSVMSLEEDRSEHSVLERRLTNYHMQQAEAKASLNYNVPQQFICIFNVRQTIHQYSQTQLSGKVSCAEECTE